MIVKCRVTVKIIVYQQAKTQGSALLFEKMMHGSGALLIKAPAYDAKSFNRQVMRSVSVVFTRTYTMWRNTFITTDMQLNAQLLSITQLYSY